LAACRSSPVRSCWSRPCSTGRGFGADAAGTLLGLAALTAFVVVYGQAATATGPAPSVLCGWTAFLLSVAVLRLVQPPPVLSLIFVAACFALGRKLRCLLFRADYRPAGIDYRRRLRPRGSGGPGPTGDRLRLGAERRLRPWPR